MTVDPCDTVVLLLLIVVVFVPDGSSSALFRKQDVDQSQTESKISCVNINFINNYGKPFRIWKTVSPRKFKGFVVHGKNYKLKTMVGSLRNNKPLVYHAVPLTDEPEPPILLDGEESIRILPFDCDEDFVNVTVSTSVEKQKNNDLDEVAPNSNSNTASSPRHLKASVPNKAQLPGTSNTTQESASLQYSVCKFTIGGNSEHSCCRFPFVYRGDVQHHCIMGHRDALWCATTANYDVDPQWGYCR